LLLQTYHIAQTHLLRQKPKLSCPEYFMVELNVFFSLEHRLKNENN